MRRDEFREKLEETKLCAGAWTTLDGGCCALMAFCSVEERKAIEDALQQPDCLPADLPRSEREISVYGEVKDRILTRLGEEVFHCNIDVPERFYEEYDAAAASEDPDGPEFLEGQNVLVQAAMIAADLSGLPLED